MGNSQKSYFHLGGSTPLLGDSIATRFMQTARLFGDQDAVVSCHQQRQLNYRELAELVDQIAAGLVGLGFQSGDRIGIWSTNQIEWYALQLACARIGAILVNINPAYRPGELAYALQKSEVSGLVTIPAFRSSHYVEMQLELIPELGNSAPGSQRGDLSCADFPALKQVIVFDPSAPQQTNRPADGFTTWQELLAAGAAIASATLDELTDAIDCDDPTNIQYTSGTTGSPKAVVLSHHNILNNAWFAAQSMEISEHDRVCVTVPFYHCFGTVLCNLLAVTTGAALVLPAEHFDPLATLTAVERERCTLLHGVPTMFIAQLEHPQFAQFDVSSLRTGIMAGAPCPAPLMRRVIDEMHVSDILIGYGQTEASPLTHLTRSTDSLERRTETVGCNLPHQEVKVVDVENGRTVAVGEVGEICFRGYHVMSGYYGDADATAESINAHGWLASGDLGTMDEAGYVKITGRRKDMVIRGGENIYPAEVEEVMFSHPDVVEAAVFGIVDEFYGEELVAWVKRIDDSSLTTDQLRDHCRQQLAHFKVPKNIRFVTEFPMTVTGKLQKFVMREQEAELQATEAA